jgi:aldehyde dehydrogenase (NAD+)
VVGELSVPQPPGDGLRVAASVARLRATFESGRTRELRWRLEQLGALEAMLRREAPAIEAALASDLGRSGVESHLTEVYGPLREVRTLRHGLPLWSRERRVPLPAVLRPGRSAVRHEPLGTVLVVSPWNYPVNLAVVPLAAALAAGNCCVLKPSEHAPASAELLAGLLPRHLDADAVAVEQGGPQVTEALIDAGVDHVFFTGSSAVGRLVAQRAGGRLIPVTLELGGKCPVVVDGGVDLEVAARRIAWGKLLNAGQTCIAPDYVLAVEPVLDDLVVALRRAVVALYGTDPRSSADYGRIVNDAHVERLAGLLEGHGGEIVLGGEVERADRYVAPTIVRRPDPGSALLGEEIFGPLLPVLGVAGIEEAGAFVAARPSPLALYVFSEDDAAVERLAGATRSGSVVVNTTLHQFASSRLPFGGVGQSGSGRYHGRYGFETLSQLRPVLRKPLRPDPSFAYPPYGPLRASLLRRFLR